MLRYLQRSTCRLKCGPLNKMDLTIRPDETEHFLVLIL